MPKKTKSNGQESVLTTADEFAAAIPGVILEEGLKKAATSTKVNAEKQLEKGKPKKNKMIRDSFTMPESDYAKLAELKKKCLESGIHVKKSELLRAGLIRLSKLNKSALLQAVAQVEAIKTGRPAKG